MTFRPTCVDVCISPPIQKEQLFNKYCRPAPPPPPPPPPLPSNPLQPLPLPTEDLPGALEKGAPGQEPGVGRALQHASRLREFRALEPLGGFAVVFFGGLVDKFPVWDRYGLEQFEEEFSRGSENSWFWGFGLISARIRDAYEILSDPVKMLLYDTGACPLF